MNKETKTCKTCKKEKLLSDFYGKSNDCKDCYNAKAKRRREELKLQHSQNPNIPAEKFCRGCKRTLTKDKFRKKSQSKDGLDFRCKECRADAWQRQMADPDKRKRFNERIGRYIDSNSDKVNAQQVKRRAENPERYARYNKTAYEKNKASGKRMAYANMRRANELNATPIWANKKRIEMVYREAKLLTKETGEPHHVDHIDPLNHELVCGLHVAENLVPIRAKNNLAKNNSFTPYRIDQKGVFFVLDEERWAIAEPIYYGLFY